MILSGPSGPPPALPEPSKLSATIVDELTKRLLTSLRYKTTWPSDQDRTEARRWLEPARFRARRALAPAEPEHIIKAIETLADTLQTGTPEQNGQLVYIGLLQQVPYLALRVGCVELLKTFAYPRLPYPAEILAACGPAHAELQFWAQSVDRAIALLEKPS